MKPFTRLYGFFDGEDVNEYIVPKLLEIQMTSGVFSPGETVEGRVVFNSSPNSSAQVALQNSTGGLNNSSSAEGVEVALGNANTPQSSITNTISESATAPEITFRVAQSNHKYGPYNNATTIYSNNPYDKLQLIPSSYSSTSTILNVDTFSLSEKIRIISLGIFKSV